MTTDATTNKFVGFAAAVLTGAVAILTTALVITSNATQGSLNRVHNGVIAMDLKVVTNTTAIGKLDTKISTLIARIEAQTASAQDIQAFLTVSQPSEHQP